MTDQTPTEETPMTITKLARDLTATDVLEYQAMSWAGVWSGLPIKRLKSHRDGRVEIDVEFIDGTTRYKTFAPGDLVHVRGEK
jgi:hypothetical protein